MNQTRVHTYSSIADQNQVDKRTVQAWVLKHKQDTNIELGELVNGVRLFNDEEKQTLETYKKPVYKPQSDQPVQTFTSKNADSEINVEIINAEIEDVPKETTSNCGKLAINSKYDVNKVVDSILGEFTEVIQDPFEFVAVIDKLCSVTERAFDAERTKKELEISKIRTANSQVVKRKSEFFVRSEIAKSVRTDQAREMANLARQLETNVNDVTNMGKPKES